VKKKGYKKHLNQDFGLGGINLNIQVSKSDFSSSKKITKNIPYENPTDLLRLILIESKEEINSFLRNNKEFSLKPELDLILSFSERDLISYPNLLKVSNYLKKLLIQYNSNYKDFLQEKLYSGIGGMIEAQRAGIISFLTETEKRSFTLNSKLKIKDIYKDDDITEEQAEMVVFSLESASELIPDKYKRKIKPITLLIRSESSGSAPCATIEDGEFVIALNFKKNNIIQAAEAFHEYVHLVEKSNPYLMEASKGFIRSRVISESTLSLEELGKDYNVNYSPSASKIQVYPGRFLDGYAGRTYGDPFGKELVPTEIFSIGAEALFLDPIGFFIKDNEHYNLVKDLVYGLI
jgi:hypothetical protein